jgi:hypothetical protein
VDGSRLLAAARELRRCRGVERRVRAVLEISLGEVGLPEDGTDGGEVRFLGAVRGAGDGELLVREPQRVCGTGADERDRLEGFGRGAGVCVAFRVAHGLDELPFGVADGDASPVYVLHEIAASHGDERCVLGESPGLQIYPPVRATIRRSSRSWATRIRAIAAGKSPPAW